MAHANMREALMRHRYRRDSSWIGKKKCISQRAPSSCGHAMHMIATRDEIESIIS
jgi:hypothetical protein